MITFSGSLTVIERVLFPINAKKYIGALGFYATFLSTIDALSMKEALKDANGKNNFIIDDDIVNATVSEISHAVLWNCREYSVTKNFYKGIYAFGYALLFSYLIIFMTSWKKPGNCGINNILKIISEVVYRFSLAFMLTSYDVDPLACFTGPESISYDESEQAVDLTFNTGVLRYQKGAAVISVVFALIAFSINIAAFILYYCCDGNEDDEQEIYTITHDQNSITLKKLKNKENVNMNLDSEHYITVNVIYS